MLENISNQCFSIVENPILKTITYIYYKVSNTKASYLSSTFIYINLFIKKYISINFKIPLYILINYKNKINNFIFIILNLITNKVYFEPVKITIKIFGLRKIILDAIILYFSLLNSIITNQVILFTTKFF